MRIDVWSDVVCPWCFLGKRRLDRVLAGLAWGGEVEVRWRAYRLDPNAPPEPGEPGGLRGAIERRYGPGAYGAMTRRLTALGEAEGIAYRFDRARRASTRDAHRLLAWAWETGGAAAQAALQERLFRCYFEEGGDVAGHESLGMLAASAGLDGAAARAVLAGDGYAAEVDADQREALARDVVGVPAFLVDGRFMIPGAQEPETFRLLLERARERFSPA